jgi:hypothetical protein
MIAHPSGPEYCRESIPLDAIRRPRDTPVWKLEAALKCRSCKKGRYAPPVHMIKLTQEREITPYVGLRLCEPRPHGEWQRLLSVQKSTAWKFHGGSPCFCSTSIPSIRALTGLLDHAVRPLEHHGRHCDADVPRRLEVHD